ncbi:hypothetical protein [Leifsonia sp. Leaf264]|uniref:hypothetical protein n=1 Tax=Leifsonia sp. Leaf264 TaxID=1736314 RepID=UPI0006F9A39E|nr:hypothetical protein [Leifsonia sp. Leaf264]KQO98346.1 hypothetical protein ASF30_09810 [Leifsonia sp. Leaf264]
MRPSDLPADLWFVIAVAAVAVTVTIIATHILATVHGTRLARRILLSTGSNRNRPQRNVANLLALLPVNLLLTAQLEDRADGCVNITWPLHPRTVILEVTSNGWALSVVTGDYASMDVLDGGILTDPAKVARLTRRAYRRTARHAAG